jgi:predicted phage-related endonuclease
VQRLTIPKPADREEWLALRRSFFNASATAVLFDRHPFQSAGDNATTKLTGVEQAQTKAMRRGIMLEDVVARWWGEEHACGVTEVDDLYVAGPVMATVDRWCVDDDCPIEIKTTNYRTYEPAPYWLDQCQAIMLCTGRDAIWLVWFDPSMELHEKLIGADPTFQDALVERAERFMAAIELGIVPDWVELSFANVAAIHPVSEGVMELEDDDLLLVQSLDATRRIRRDAEKDEGVIKDALAKRLLAAEAGTYGGFEILSWRTSKPTTALDVEMLKADHPDLVEKYTFERAGRRVMLVKLDGAAR